MKGYKYLSSIIIIFSILIISIISIFTPDDKISELEGRKLQVMPTISNLIIKEKSHNFNAYAYETLTGDLFKSWDSYFSDHIFQRNTIVNIYTKIQNKVNKEYLNGVYIGKNDYFITNNNQIEYNDSQLKLRAEYFNNISEKFKYSNMYMVNIPYKNEVYKNEMPIEGYKPTSNYYFNKMLEYIDKNKINVIDINNIFSSNENLYHKTDHHWNMNGTWKAYEKIISELNEEFSKIGKPKTNKFYSIENYSKCFVGTDGRKVGQIVSLMDNIDLYVPKNEEDFKVYINNQEARFFYRENISKDKFNNDYQVYLNGDNPEVIVENTKSNNDLSIVVIGDSMDNPLIALLAPHFKTIYSYDLRSYKESIIDTIDEIKPDIIMFIGLTNNFIDKDSQIFDEIK